MGYARRRCGRSHLGPGFDSPRLHQTNSGPPLAGPSRLSYQPSAISHQLDVSRKSGWCLFVGGGRLEIVVQRPWLRLARGRRPSGELLKGRSGSRQQQSVLCNRGPEQGSGSTTTRCRILARFSSALPARRRCSCRSPQRCSPEWNTRHGAIGPRVQTARASASATSHGRRRARRHALSSKQQAF